MALNRKYAGLPDLDSGADTYATPELTEDNSTNRTRTDSSASSYHDFDEPEKPNGISRVRFNADEARQRFEGAQVDARDVDFSDRVTAKRKSYKTSSRRQRNVNGEEVIGEFSDEEGESLERKMARLRREVEEVKEEFKKRDADAEKAKENGERVVGEEDVAELSKMLTGISTSRPKAASTSNGVKFAKDIGTGIRANGPAETTQGTGEATYTVTYAPTYQQSHALAKAADFDGRLAMLERAMGINSSEMPTTTVLPALDAIQRQLSVITEATPSSLDSLSRRVRALTQEAERLEEARKSAKAAQDALREASPEAPVLTSGEDNGDEMAKVNALYGSLTTIDTLAPILPAVLDRLRSLRAIHADAATASDSLGRVEKSQADMVEDTKKWREALERVEEAMKTGEATMAGNMSVVQGWVNELEAKIAGL